MHFMNVKTVRRAADFIFRRLNRANDKNLGLDSQISPIEECMGLGALSVAAKLLNVSDFQELIENRLGKLSVYETWTQAPLDAISELLDALIELNQVQLARQMLKELDNYQDNSGLIPVRPRAHWVSTAGIAHLALCWQKVGQSDRLESVVKWLEKHQRDNGGFHAGYGWRAPFEFRRESAWTAKWYLDAHYFRVRQFMEREVTASHIPNEDGRFLALKKLIRPGDKVLEVGCGKGRYLRAIRNIFPDVQCTGADIVPFLLSSIPSEISTIEASMEAVPSPDNSYDVVFSVEALEHSANFQAAIREMSRIAKQGGWVAVIDKERRKWGKLECPPWERWPVAEELARIFEEYCDEVHYEPVGYDGRPPDGLMMIWQGRKRGSVSATAKSLPASPAQ
jgi:malonyl-CoA O-methyltransferase